MEFLIDRFSVHSRDDLDRVLADAGLRTDDVMFSLFNLYAPSLGQMFWKAGNYRLYASLLLIRFAPGKRMKLKVGEAALNTFFQFLFNNSKVLHVGPIRFNGEINEISRRPPTTASFVFFLFYDHQRAEALCGDLEERFKLMVCK